MNNDEIVLRKSVVNEIWRVAQTCIDENRKRWRVMMPRFRDAMDALDFTAKEVRAALAYLEARTFVITFLEEDGGFAGIYVVPQRYRCEFCGMWLNTQDDPETHIDLCLRLQRKMERNRKLA